MEKKTPTTQWNFNKDNEWYTYEKDVEYFLDNTNFRPDLMKMTVWCPFDTEDSAFVKVLKRRGYNVIATHIDNGQDFFTYEPEENYDMILSNPPFSGKAKTMERLIELGKPFGMIFGIQCFNSGGFTRLLKDIKTLSFIMICKRVKYHKGVEVEKSPAPTFHTMWICNDLGFQPIEIWEGAK